MPELPEVETVRRGLAPVMEGSRLTRLELARPDLRFAFPDRFSDRVEGTVVTSLSRRGKYLLCELDNAMTIIMHLGMSGSFRIESGAHIIQPGSFYHTGSAKRPHDHVVFALDGPNGPASVVYNDPRRFGFMDLVFTAEAESNRFLAKLGIDPLGNGLSPQALANSFMRRAAPLKSVLLDQRVIAGLGNIYVCEALWHARLSPFRRAGSLILDNGRPAKKCDHLIEAIRHVLAAAIKAGGSTLRDHRQIDGELGYFQHSFSVYDRLGDACQRKSCNGTIGRDVQSSRSTYWCRSCQH